MRWIVTGQVFLADGFDYEIEADTEAQARKIAKRQAYDDIWPEAEIQEVCINGSQEVES